MEDGGTDYSMDMNIRFIAQNDEDMIVKWKLHQRQKLQYYAGSTILAHCKHLQRPQHANTKLAKHHANTKLDT